MHIRTLALGIGLVLLMAVVIGHLLIQCDLHHSFRELLQQPSGAGHGQALRPRQPHQLFRYRPLRGEACCRDFTETTVVVITVPFPPSSRSARRAESIVSCSVQFGQLKLCAKTPLRDGAEENLFLVESRQIQC